jgi:integrase
MAKMDDMFELEDLEEDEEEDRSTTERSRRRNQGFTVARPTYKDRTTGKKRRSPYYFVQFKGRDGKWKKFKAADNERDAERIGENIMTIMWLCDPVAPRRLYGASGDILQWFEGLPEKQRDQLTEWCGIPDSFGTRSDTISARVDQWHDELLAKGCTKGHADLLKTRVNRIIDGCGFRNVADLTEKPIVKWLGKRTMKMRTRNHYITHVKQFAKWLVENRVLTADPLLRLKKGKVTDERERRALTDQELEDLIKTARASKEILFGHDGRFRALVYSLAAQTGLRVGEIRKLTVGDFRLDGEEPHVVVRASIAKNAKVAYQPLVGRLPSQLKGYIGRMDSETRPFPVTTRAADMIKEDLAAAKIPQKTAEGVADFHALRNTFITRLALANISPAQAMKLARHSTPELTMRVYTKVSQAEARAAVERLSDLPE